VLLLCYITDRMQFAADENTRRRALLNKIAEAARCGVNFVQLREKDLPARELESLACKAVQVIRDNSSSTEPNQLSMTRLLINSRTDLAIASGADGVHLPANEISPRDVRAVWGQSSNPPIVSVACHNADDVVEAAAQGADYAVFAPIFEKKDDPSSHPAGLAGLREACRIRIPVLALGGITLENARACHETGAAGIAAIRLFQENDIAEVVKRLRSQ
jgi:thiamine-phosphate pyrophosphorylase